MSVVHRHRRRWCRSRCHKLFTFSSSPEPLDQFHQTWNKASLDDGDSWGNNYERMKIHWRNLKIVFSRTTGPISTKFGAMHPWVKRIPSLFKWRPPPFLRGDNYDKAKIHWWTFKNCARTTGPISTNISTKHQWVTGNQFCSNERSRLFPRVHNYKIVIIHWQILKIFFSRTTGLIWTKLGTKHSWVDGIQVYSNEGPRPFQRGDNYEIAASFGELDSSLIMQMKNYSILKI